MKYSSRKIHEDENGPYIILSSNAYRPNKHTERGIGSSVLVRLGNNLECIYVGKELWLLAEENVIWRSDGIW